MKTKVLKNLVSKIFGLIKTKVYNTKLNKNLIHMLDF